MYSLIEYSKSYSETSGRLWNYYRDEPNSLAEDNINYSINDPKFFDYETSITEKLEINNVGEEKVKTAVSLKHLSNCWRTLDIPLINCEVSLTLTWSENCVLTSKATRYTDPEVDPVVAVINDPVKAIFKIIDTKLYVPQDLKELLNGINTDHKCLKQQLKLYNCSNIY